MRKNPHHRIYTTIIIGLLFFLPYSCSKTEDNSILITDGEGNVYKTKTIGTQIWMKENLRTTKYSNGDLIGTTTNATDDFSNELTPKYQWSYEGNESYVLSYGRLYTWYAITDNRNICPTGWHIPTDAEWAELITNLGGESLTGGRLKENGITHWQSPNKGANNTSGFTALPGGGHGHDGNFSNLGLAGNWWTATEYDATLAGRLYIDKFGSFIYWASAYKQDGFSVRCVKDN